MAKVGANDGDNVKTTVGIVEVSSFLLFDIATRIPATSLPIMTSATRLPIAATFFQNLADAAGSSPTGGGGSSSCIANGVACAKRELSWDFGRDGSFAVVLVV